MIDVVINAKQYKVKKGISILEACQYAGIRIPRFCYHEILSSSGNCRMCLVEITEDPLPGSLTEFKLEEREKPAAACATEILSGMGIYTDSPFVYKARESVLEFILLNHPLDCPICDQAGECDLQDQTKLYGFNHSRVRKNKSTVINKQLSPYINTIMTRCITCTRCVRFAAEIANEPDAFGTINRGGHTEISSFLTRTFNSEISGNIVDLCPVGALTAKTYALKLRPWELRTTESIDITDNLCSNIYVQHKDNKIARILPKQNININGSLIADKGRYSYYANYKNRTSNKLQSLTFNKKYKINNVLTDKLDLFTITYNNTLSYLFPKTLQTYNLTHFDNSNLYLNLNLQYYKKLINTHKSIIQFGSHLRYESPIFNTQLKITHNSSDINIFNIGNNYKTTYETQHIHINNPISILTGQFNIISQNLAKQLSPYLIFSSNYIYHTFNTTYLLNNIFNINRPHINQQYIYPNPNTISILKYPFTNFNLHNKIHKIINLTSYNLSNNIFTYKTFNKIRSKLKHLLINTHLIDESEYTENHLKLNTHFEAKHLYFNLESRPQTSKSINNNKFLNNNKLKLINDNSTLSLYKSTITNNKLSHPDLNSIKEIINTPTLYNSINHNTHIYSIINKLNIYNNILAIHKTPIFNFNIK